MFEVRETKYEKIPWRRAIRKPEMEWTIKKGPLKRRGQKPGVDTPVMISYKKSFAKKEVVWNTLFKAKALIQIIERRDMLASQLDPMV